MQDPYPLTPNGGDSLASLACTASFVCDPEAFILSWWSTRQHPQKILAPKTNHCCGFRGIYPHGSQDELAATKNMDRGGAQRARQELWQWDGKMQQMEADGRGCQAKGLETHSPWVWLSGWLPSWGYRDAKGVERDWCELSLCTVWPCPDKAPIRAANKIQHITLSKAELLSPLLRRQGFHL